MNIHIDAINIYLSSPSAPPERPGIRMTEGEFLNGYMTGLQEGRFGVNSGVPLSANEGDMRHAVTVQFGDLTTTLNAHDAVKLVAWLETYRDQFTVLSEQLDQTAMAEDQADIAQIDREWQAYRNEGLGERG